MAKPNSDESQFLELIETLTKNRKINTIIGLDHNLDLLKAHKHKTTQKFIDKILNHNHIPVITKPTRITKSTATLIDNIVISQKLQSNFHCGILIDDISDHLPCFIRIENVKPGLKTPEVRKYRKLNDDAISEINVSLKECDWSELTNRDCSNSFDYFHQKLTDIIDSHAPEKEKTVYHKRPIEPWISKSLLKCMKKQKQLYCNTLNSASEDGIHLKYKAYRTCLSRLKRYYKLEYYHQKCIDFRQNTKKLWKLVNTAIGKHVDKSGIIECIKSGNLKLYSSKAIANEMAEYFATVGKKFANNIPSPNTSVHDYNKRIMYSEKSLFMSPTNKYEILTIVKNLTNKSSSGCDDISNSILKKIIDNIVEPLVIIFNKSLSTGIFPEAMKLADVVPLHKGKSKEYVTNYRPISLLITISKILEKIVYTRTYSHLESTGQIYRSQYGFRSRHSCENAISELTSEITKSKEIGLHTLTVFLDLSKAFDTLDHTILYEKLHRYGIRGPCLNWYRSYLTNRSLRVKCIAEESGNTTYSDLHEVEYGTPQGSCLGPLIFLIFSNDIYLHLQHVSCILFADDTTLYLSHRNLRYAKWCLTEDLSTLSDWFKANKLTLNLNKTVMMHFNKKDKNKTTLSVNGINVPHVAETKFLGVWIDDNLSWQSHIAWLEGKLKSNLSLLRRSKNLLSVDTKKLIYYAHIFSHLTYCILLWGSNLPNASLNRLQKIQDRCINEIKKGPNVSKIYKDLGILKVREIVKLE